MKEFFVNLIRKIRDGCVRLFRQVKRFTQWVSELFYGALVRTEAWVQWFANRTVVLLGSMLSLTIRALGILITAIPTFLMFTKSAWQEYGQMWKQFTFTPKMNWHGKRNVVHLHTQRKAA